MCRLKKAFILLVILSGCSPYYVELKDSYKNTADIYQCSKVEGKYVFLLEDARTEREITTILQNSTPFYFLSTQRYRGLDCFKREIFNSISLFFPYATFDTLTEEEQKLLEKDELSIEEIVKRHDADGVFMQKVYNLVLGSNGDFRGTYRFQLKNLKTGRTLVSGFIERKKRFGINTVPYFPVVYELYYAYSYQTTYKEAEEWFVHEIVNSFKDSIKISKKYYDFERGFTGRMEKNLSKYLPITTLVGLREVSGIITYLIAGPYMDEDLKFFIGGASAGFFVLSIPAQDYINGNMSGSFGFVGCLTGCAFSYLLYKDLSFSSKLFMIPLISFISAELGFYCGSNIRFEPIKDYKGGLKKYVDSSDY